MFPPDDCIYTADIFQGQVVMYGAHPPQTICCPLTLVTLCYVPTRQIPALYKYTIQGGAA